MQTKDRTTVTEINDPQGGRNKIRKGDRVKVQLGKGQRTWPAEFLGATVEADGTVHSVDVYGAPGNKAPAMRTLDPSTISRVAQTRNGEGRWS